jgi:hypothetical protein
MKHKNKHSVINVVIRILTLAISITALMMSISNKNHIEWVEGVQDNIIQNVLLNQ